MITYKKQLLTLDNYNDILKKDGFPLDVLDEVRLALMDNIPLTSQDIISGKRNPYRLNQIRLALKEYVPQKLLYPRSGKVIFAIRELWRKRVNPDIILRSLSSHLPEETALLVCQLLSEGYDLSKYHFEDIPAKSLDVYEWGIRHGLPMEVFIGRQKVYTREYMLVCCKLISYNRDVEQFLSEDWDLEVLERLASIADKAYYEMVVSYINKNATLAYLWAIIDCAANAPSLLPEVSKIDREGYPLYNDAQIACILKAYHAGLDYQSLCDSSLDISRLNDMYATMLFHKNDRIGGRLHKTIK